MKFGGNDLPFMPHHLQVITVLTGSPCVVEYASYYKDRGYQISDYIEQFLQHPISEGIGKKRKHGVMYVGQLVRNVM